VPEVIRFGKFDKPALLIESYKGGDGFAGRDGEDLQAGLGAQERDAVLKVELGEGAGGKATLGLDEDSVGTKGSCSGDRLDGAGKRNREIREIREKGKGREEAHKAQNDAPDCKMQIAN
jgi:hypothetical protein